MTKQQALLDMKNFFTLVPEHQKEKFLDQLLNEFDDPEGWLMNVDERVFKDVLNKYYYKVYRYGRKRLV